MLSVQTLAERIRSRLHDKDKLTYEDTEILDCINCGVRFIRRTIAVTRPALLTSEHKGILSTGVSAVTLATRPSKVINVTIGNPEVPLEKTEMAFVIHKDVHVSGEPKKFFLTGAQTINFYPTPVAATPYTIRTVDDIEELGWEDNSPLNNEFDDFLVEYATIRLSVGNEYDMTQESQLMANIVVQINQIIAPPPAGFVVRGYWDEIRH